MADGRCGEGQGQVGDKELLALDARGTPNSASTRSAPYRPNDAAGAHKPLSPIENARHITIASSEVRGIWFDLMAAIPAPHDEANTGGDHTAESHRRTRQRFRPPISVRRGVSAWLSLAVAHNASAVAATARAPA
jgi:hypothetical protein